MSDLRKKYGCKEKDHLKYSKIKDALWNLKLQIDSLDKPRGLIEIKLDRFAYRFFEHLCLKEMSKHLCTDLQLKRKDFRLFGIKIKEEEA